jgi:hypothetical protein
MKTEEVLHYINIVADEKILPLTLKKIYLILVK